MKNVLLLLLAIILFNYGCKEKTTNPPDEQKPIGYQEDIPWPSLANTPWPMHKGNPQCTGRSKGLGPQFNHKILQLILGGINSSIGLTNFVIGADTTIYFGSSYEQHQNTQTSYLYAVKRDGTVKWKFRLIDDTLSSPLNSFWVETTPIVASNGTIYCGSQNGSLYAVNSEGILQWRFKANDMINFGGINIGLDGRIYFLAKDGYIYCVNKDGTLSWKLKTDGGFLSNPGTGIAFSPDGETLYLGGNTYTGSKSFYAISKDGQVKWNYDNGKNIYGTPLVDFEGNVYFNLDKKDTISDYGLIILKPNGEKRRVYKYYTAGLSEPTIDKGGNIYFGEFNSINQKSMILSQDYYGNLRWTYEVEDMIQNPIICDINGNIYYYDNGVKCLNSSGKLLWSYKVGLLSYACFAAGFNQLFLGTIAPEKGLYIIQ